MRAECSQPGCNNPRARRDLCNAHLRRERRYGRPDYYPDSWRAPGRGGAGNGDRNTVHDKGGGNPVTVGQRIASSIEVSEGGCWLWTRTCDRLGYGRMQFPGKLVLAHRASYEAHVGPIPEGLELDHLCMNPPCVNPDHLEPVTHQENMRRAAAHRRRMAPENHRPIEMTAAHGTATGYVTGCRCEPCTEANADRCRDMKRSRRQRLADDPSLAPHGKASTYSNWGCRCEPCTRAHRTYFKEWLSKRAV